MKIGLISDTHGFLDDRIFDYFKEVDEIWHAGDLGTLEVLDNLSGFKRLRSVYGNIDNNDIRVIVPENLVFTIDKLKIWMIHIGGYPPKYSKKIINLLDEIHPDIFICGHSHIVKIIKDPVRNLLHINPGAAGKDGFHKIKTIIRFEINADKISNMQLIELNPRR